MKTISDIIGKQRYLRILNKFCGCHGKATLRAHHAYLYFINNHPFESKNKE